MFAVIYRSTLHSGKEEAYQASWHAIASYFVQVCGALGSCLHKAEDGIWVAYSRWPSRAQRDIAWPSDGAISQFLPTHIQQHIACLKACIEESYPEICLEVVDDLLLPTQK